MHQKISKDRQNLQSLVLKSPLPIEEKIPFQDFISRLYQSVKEKPSLLKSTL